MGVWGTGILSDDTVRDVVADYIDLFNRGTRPEIIRQKLSQSYNSSLRDSDDGPLVLIGIAKAQWDCGQLESVVLADVRNMIRDGLGLARWEEQGSLLLEKRESALRRFLAKLETENLKPRKPKKAIKRKPLFQPGDCVAVRLMDGEWGAILILQGETESTDPFKETYGSNLAVALRYKSLELPALDVFKAREWLIRTHPAWKGKMDICNVSVLRSKKVLNRLKLVGNTALRSDDPKGAMFYGNWATMLDALDFQYRWEQDQSIRN